MHFILLAQNIFRVSFPGLGIRDMEVNRIAFVLSLFGKEFPIYMYGLIISSAFVLCMILASRRSYIYGIRGDDILNMFLLIIPASIIGARIYYVAFAFDEFRDDLSRIFNTRHGGLAFYGGVILGGIVLILYCKYKKIDYATLCDFIVVYLPLGQAIGRWGNFFNQEAFGINTKAPWGMISDGTAAYLSLTGQGDPMLPVHPTFLYESIGNIIIFIILLDVRRKSRIKFVTCATYLATYGFLRFFTEGLRTDSLYAGGNLRISQLLSLIMFVAGLAWIILASRPHIRKEEKYTRSEILREERSLNQGFLIFEDEYNREDYEMLMDAMIFPEHKLNMLISKLRREGENTDINA